MFDHDDEEVVRAIHSVPCHYARDENPPFERGTTFYGSETPNLTDAAAISLEGKEFVFEDVDPRNVGTGASKRRTGRKVRCRIVRNRTGAALLPKRVCAIDTAHGVCTANAAGYTAVSADPLTLGVVDEYLPAGGVADQDLFWAVVEGPALVLTDLAGGASNVINVNDRLVALTAVTSGATTAGRVKTQDVTGATTALAQNVQNQIGRALTAATTANTNTAILCDVRTF